MISWGEDRNDEPPTTIVKVVITVAYIAAFIGLIIIQTVKGVGHG